MKKYALLLACLTWAAFNVSGQSAGGGAAGGGGGGGATGSAGGAGTGATGGSVGTGGAGTGIGGAPAAPGNLRPIAPGLQTPVNPTPGLPGVGTPGGPATGTGAGVGSSSGAIGGVGPGTGGTGGNAPITGGPLDQGSPTTGIQPGAGVSGLPGTGVGTGGATLPGVTTQPGVGIGETGAGTISGSMTGTPADMAMAQRVRAELLNGGMGVGGPATPGASRVPGQGTLSAQTLGNVQINANNGAITLQGSVPSEAERRAIETRVRRLGGVRTVVNNLTVGTAGGGNLTAPNSRPAVGTSGAGVTGSGGASGTPVTRP